VLPSPAQEVSLQIAIIGWRDGSALKSTDCSSRGHEFNSQQPYESSQPSPSVMGSNALFFFFFFWFFETGFLCMAWLSWNSLCRPGWLQTQKSACLCLPNSGIKGVRYHCPAPGHSSSVWLKTAAVYSYKLKQTNKQSRWHVCRLWEKKALVLWWPVEVRGQLCRVDSCLLPGSNSG
jgi:hypothetical protein